MALSQSRNSSDVDRLMERLRLDPIPATQKKPAGTIGTSTQKIITNIHGLKVPDALQVYRYDVTIKAVRIINGKEWIIDLTKKARSDAIVTNRKDLCRSLFRTAVEEHPEVFGPFEEICYDLQSTLFTRKVITEDVDGVTYDVTNPHLVQELPGARAQIKIKPVMDTRGFDASELALLSSSLEEVDHSLQQSLELETSHTALMNAADHITYPGGKSFLMNPANHGFNNRDAPSLGHGKYLGIGCQKSIRYIEGPRDPGNKRVGVVVDTKKTPFHASLPMVQIADNQRVRTEHKAPEMVQNMIRACAVPSSTLIPQNERNGLALGLYGDNKSPHLEAMGIDVVDRPVVVSTRVIPPPYIQYRNNMSATPEPARATWSQRAHYLVPCELGRWAIYVLGTMPSRNRSKFEETELLQFLSCFQQQCGRVGVPYVAPAKMKALPIDVNAVEQEFKICKDDGFTFIFFIYADNDQSLHKVVKLFERKYELTTQLVKMQNAGDIVTKGKQQTMENIIRKTNIKLGGVNYELRLPEKDIAETLGAETINA